MPPSLFFNRDTNGNAVDLIIKAGRNLVPVEIKSSATFTEEVLKGLVRFGEVAGARASKGSLMYNERDRFNVKGIAVFNPFLHGDLRTPAAVPR